MSEKGVSCLYTREPKLFHGQNGKVTVIIKIFNQQSTKNGAGTT